jgi:trehalose/maltose hydrolase-like predicted phosphorylase
MPIHYENGNYVWRKWNHQVSEDSISKEEILDKVFEAVYAQYPTREWQDLSDEEVTDLANFWDISDISIEPFIDKVVRKLKEKNNG